LTAKNAAILGVSFDTVEENKRFAEKFNFPYPLLSDPTRSMGVQYGAADSTGAGNAKRVAYIIGPDGKVRNVFPKANTSTFAADVLALL
jgi:thioredoxin-dependent peroxiredoxin